MDSGRRIVLAAGRAWRTEAREDAVASKRCDVEVQGQSTGIRRRPGDVRTGGSSMQVAIAGSAGRPARTVRPRSLGMPGLGEIVWAVLACVGVPTRNSVGTGRNSWWRDQGRRQADPRTPGARCWSRRGRLPSDVDRPRRTTPAGEELSMARRATIRPRDVRSDDASRRGAGLARSCYSPAIEQSVGLARPCPARGAFATGGSRRGTAGGGGAASARSTR